MAGKKAKWAGFSQARKEVGPAFKSTWPYTTLGLAAGIGTVLLGGPDGLIPHRLLGSILEHVGVGFIVSAIAVFFYEWGAHTKKALELSEHLSSAIRNDLAPIAQAAGEAALARGLESQLRDNSNVGHQFVPQIISNVERLTQALRRLQQDGIWCREHYIHYVADTLELIRVNAECLADLNTDDEHFFRIPPDGADPVDKILAAQMRSLDEGDSYHVITNLISWRSKRLTELFHETREAVSRRKVSVQRIFNPLFPARIGPEEVRQILAAHLEEAGRLGALFEVKILLEEHVEASPSESLKAYARIAHFGVFQHRGQRLRIKLEKLDLSEIMMRTGDLDFETNLFHDAWLAAQPLTPELITQCVALFQPSAAKVS